MIARRFGTAQVLGLWLSLAAISVAATPVTSHAQRAFATAEQAVDALIAATRANQVEALAQVLGPGGTKLIHSGDPVADKNERERFLAAYDEAHRIDAESSDKAVLIVGKEEWPLPIPLTHTSSGWHFDTLAAEQEILDRRIGRNELNVIEVCRAYVEAQREYAAIMTTSGGQPEYAQHFKSHAGSHDGLYWEIKADEAQSPLGPLVAQAQAGGYATERPVGRREPYHGYYFKILTRQGAHAPGGAKNYVTDEHMTGGFGLVAYPAIYGDSGIMTFIVGAEGIVFEKNLGPKTESIARRIEAFDPDESWHTP
jgi:hypothetical protein